MSQPAENDVPLGDWFRRTPESLRMLAEEAQALRSAEIDRPARHMGPERRKVSHAPRCGSIQCAECYPGWGEAYNAARVTPSGE